MQRFIIQWIEPVKIAAVNAVAWMEKKNVAQSMVGLVGIF